MNREEIIQSLENWVSEQELTEEQKTWLRKEFMKWVDSDIK